MKRNTNVYIPPTLKSRLLVRCLREGRDQSELIAEALTAYLRRKPNTNGQDGKGK